MLDVALPGTGGTTPRADRHLTCAYLRVDGCGILVDCGEGTQIAVKKAGFSLSKIGLILLTHFHADHVAGLPGLLLTMGNEGRREKVRICGPAGVGEIVRSLCVIAQELPFPMECVPLSDMSTLSYKGVDVTAFAVHHTCACLGYDFRMRRGGRFDRAKAEANGVPMRVWRTLQNRQSAEWDGVTYTPDMVLGEVRRGLHVVYATDTRPTEMLGLMATEADLAILEGMFAEDAKENRARETCHMTIPEACRIAREAQPVRLWLTHYSPSLPNPQEHAKQVSALYPAAVLAKDGETITLRFADEE